MLEQDDKIEALSRQVQHLGGELERMAERVQALQHEVQLFEVLLILVLTGALGSTLRTGDYAQVK